MGAGILNDTVTVPFLLSRETASCCAFTIKRLWSASSIAGAYPARCSDVEKGWIRNTGRNSDELETWTGSVPAGAVARFSSSFIVLSLRLRLFLAQNDT